MKLARDLNVCVQLGCPRQRMTYVWKMAGLFWIRNALGRWQHRGNTANGSAFTTLREQRKKMAAIDCREEGSEDKVRDIMNEISNMDWGVREQRRSIIRAEKVSDEFNLKEDLVTVWRKRAITPAGEESNPDMVEWREKVERQMDSMMTILVKLEKNASQDIGRPEASSTPDYERPDSEE